MKKIIVFIVIVLLLISCSSAETDAFLSDYNIYAESIYGIEPIASVFSSDELYSYKSANVEIMKDPNTIMIMAEEDNALDVISAACCTFRCIDNGGNMLDQYGRIMHAFFLAQSRGDEKEYRATTESGYLVYVSNTNGIITITITK